MDESGQIFIVDRKKDLILTAGYNIYPAELERVIAGIRGRPGRRRPRADELKGEIAKAYIVLKDGVEGYADDITAFCRGELAAYKVPREIQFRCRPAQDQHRQGHAARAAYADGT